MSYREGGFNPNKYKVLKNREEACDKKCSNCAIGTDLIFAITCDKEKGIKYVPGDVDKDAKYFVLRYDKDPHARWAMYHYASSIKEENPQFAKELLEELMSTSVEANDSKMHNLCMISLGRLVVDSPRLYGEHLNSGNINNDKEPPSGYYPPELVYGSVELDPSRAISNIPRCSFCGNNIFVCTCHTRNQDIKENFRKIYGVIHPSSRRADNADSDS